VRKPEVFLFDEPLSNLDAKLRVEMRTQIKRLHRMLRTTTIYVTHDQVEAMTLADRVVVLRKGDIIQHGRPLELYERPNCRFVAEFIGSPQMNIIPGQLIASDRGAAVDFEGGTIALSHVAATPGAGVDIGLRPEHLIPCAPDQADFSVEIDVLEELGSDTLAICLLGAREVTVRIPAEQARNLTGRLPLRFDRGNLHLFSAEDGRRLEFTCHPQD
jgi:multiple sugar transport system ATP-binding protein